VKLQWVGHATALVDVAGRKILADPLLTRRVAHLRRRRPLPSSDVADVDTEVRVGDRVELGGSLVTAEAVPAAHEHGRGPHSRVTAPPVGYVISGEGRRVYFPGDTDLFDEMEQLTDIDVAMLPIWGWGSSLGSGHLDPTRAATATGLIRPGMVVPIHWGTYAPEDGRRVPSWFGDPLEQFEQALADAGLSHFLHLLHPGESVSVT